MNMRAVCRSVLFIAAYFAFALVLVLNVDAKSHDPEWKSFTSIKSFTVDYPSSWVSIDKSGIRLHILSSAARLTAVVIARGASEITVDELRPRQETEHIQDTLKNTMTPRSMTIEPSQHRGTNTIMPVTLLILAAQISKLLLELFKPTRC